MQGMGKAQQYERCMVLAGGGFRFGYYLGMHAALEEAGHAPDLLLATCGGAVAAAVIGRLPDATARKQWLSSPEMYAFCGALQSTALAAPRHMASGRSPAGVARGSAQGVLVVLVAETTTPRRPMVSALVIVMWWVLRIPQPDPLVRRRVSTPKSQIVNHL